MFQDNCRISLGFCPFLPSITRQYNNVVMQSVKPTKQTPTPLQLLVIGNKHKIGLIDANKTTKTVPTLSPLVRMAAVKTDKPREPCLQPVALPQVLTHRVTPVPRNREEEPARAENQSPVCQIQRKRGCKNKWLRKDKSQKPLRHLTVVDMPPVTESVRTLLMSNATVQQRLHHQRPTATIFPQRADGNTNSCKICCVKMWVCPAT